MTTTRPLSVLTFRVRDYPMNARLTHEFFDIERDPKAREFVLAMTHRGLPTHTE
jgi:hypothetical protein